jgi:hypothetical protein
VARRLNSSDEFLSTGYRSRGFTVRHRLLDTQRKNNSEKLSKNLGLYNISAGSTAGTT